MITYSVHPVNPQLRYLNQTVDILQNGGIAVYPTDTVYGMGASITNPNGIDRISRILLKDKQRTFSFICNDFSQISRYARVTNAHFKLMKRYLPGPYTFILPASNLVPKKICPKRKTVGIRLPDCTVVLELIRKLGEPLANTSLDLPGSLRNDPEIIKEAVSNDVDVMLDIGPLENADGSTIIDLTEETPVLVRAGKGPWNE